MTNIGNPRQVSKQVLAPPDYKIIRSVAGIDPHDGVTLKINQALLINRSND